MLADFQPVVQAAAHEAGALERAGAAADDEQGVIVWPQPGHQPFVALFAEHRTADLRMAEITEPQVDIRLALIRLAQLLRLHHQMFYRTVVDQLLPAAWLAVVGESCRRLGYGFHQTDLFGHFVGTLCDHLILGDHRDRGAGNGIQMHNAFTAGPNLELRIGRLAEVLVDEIDHFLLGDAQQQDRLAVFENPYPGDLACLVHADQRHDRLAGIRRDIDDVGRQEHITEQCFLAVDHAVTFDIRRLALAGGKFGCTGQYIGAVEVFTHRRVGLQAGGQGGLIRRPLDQRWQQQPQEQDKTDNVRVHDVGRKRTPFHHASRDGRAH